MLRETVMAKLRQALPALKQEFGVDTMHLIGSVARDDDRPDSDVDVLVTFEPGALVTLFTFARLSEALERTVGRPVDVIEDHPGLRPVFRRQVEGDKLLVA